MTNSFVSKSISKGLVDQELRLLYIHSGQSSPTLPSARSNTYYRKCYEFNNKGRCSLPNCRYIHACLRCSNPHPAINFRIPLLKNPAFATQNLNGSRTGNFRHIEQISASPKEQLIHVDSYRESDLLKLSRTPIKVNVLLSLIENYPNKKDAKILSESFFVWF